MAESLRRAVPLSVPERLYHPTVIIIPDGRVSVAYAIHVFHRRHAVRIIVIIHIIIPTPSTLRPRQCRTRVFRQNPPWLTMSRPSSKRNARARTARETSSAPFVSRDTQVVQAMLKEAGINDYDPQVVNQLLEFNYSKCTAKRYEHVGRLLSLCLFCVHQGTRPPCWTTPRRIRTMPRKIKSTSPTFK